MGDLVTEEGVRRGKEGGKERGKVSFDFFCSSEFGRAAEERSEKKRWRKLTRSLSKISWNG